MARFLDDLRRGPVRMPWFIAPSMEDVWERYAQKVLDFLQADMPVIHIANIAEYFFQSDQEYWDLRTDMPNLAPPWTQCWFEHPLPNHVYSKEKGLTDISDHFAGGRMGVLVSALDPQGQIVADKAAPDTCKWILWCEYFIDYRIRRDIVADGPHGSVFLMVDENGAIIERPWIQTYTGGLHDEILKAHITYLNPTFLAISFLHCKNVRVIDNQPDAKLVKRYRERHGGASPSGYKTLVIEPLKQILKREGGSDKVGLARALHICRGHFRDYRQGAGLFGKYNTLVWSPMTVRGNRGKKIVKERDVEVKI